MHIQHVSAFRQKCNKYTKPTFTKIYYVNRHQVFHIFIIQFWVLRWTCSQSEVSQVFWIQVSFKEMSLESSVMLFVLLTSDLGGWYYQHSNPIIPGLRSRKVLMLPVLGGFESAHLHHFWLQLTVAFQIRLTKLKIWKWSVVGLIQSTRSLTCFCGHSFHLIQTMNSFIAFPWRLQLSPHKWQKISGTYANSVNHKKSEKNVVL